MVKLLICLFSAALLAAAMLQLRQQHLQLGYQNAELHEQIRAQQAKLWDQQLQIATFTSPNAIANTVSVHDLNMVPRQNGHPATRPAYPAATPKSASPRSTTPKKTR